MKRLKMVLGLTASSLVLWGTWCSPATAADLFAGPDAVSAAPPCARDNPCRLDSAIAIANFGDTVHVLPGDYYADAANETPWVSLPDVDGGVTLAGDDPADPPLIHGHPPSLTPLIRLLGTSTLRDVHIESTTTSPGYANVIQGATDPAIENSRIVGTAPTGVFMSVCSLGGGSIRNTVCVGRGTGEATALDNSFTGMNRLTSVVNVTAISTATDGFGIRLGMSSAHTNTMNISNSIARGPDADLRTGTFTGGPVGSAIMNVEYSNWVSYIAAGMGTNQLLVDAGNQTGATAATPDFVDANGGDYRPAAGSPTIDAGSSAANLDPTTLGSTIRLFGTAVDIGANEYVPPPAVTTGAASGIGQAGATLTGSVDPNDSATTVRFEYGPTSAYGQTVDLPSLAYDDAPAALSTELTGLEPGTTYHYRLAATSNGGGEGLGDDRTFTTTEAPLPPPPPPPVSVTLSKLKIKKKWRLRKGAVLRFRVSRAANVKLTFDRRKKGKFRRHGVKFVAAKAGPNKLRLSKKLKLRRGKRLLPGRYRLTAVAVAPDGARSATRRVALRIRR